MGLIEEFSLEHIRYRGDLLSEESDVEQKLLDAWLLIKIQPY
jgi:hypothetical protein